jgi:hypothetical protein
MQVNLAKSKIIVFRNGGIIKKNEKWFYTGIKLECVSYYKYLRLLISSRLVWTAAEKTLAYQALKAMIPVKRMYRYCNGLSIEMSFKLFDSAILPILLYGSEIWGYEWAEHIEGVQRKYCRFVLGVSFTTCNSFILGECGRYPLCIFYFKELY